MNVLSLFDGMSCGQLALNRAGIIYDNYFASEIDKYAIQVTQNNFPNTIQLGDVTKWKEWELPYIDLLIGGSPCQGFSNAGKGLNFNDARSKLFFEFVDILKAYKPKYFLLENVKLKKEWRDIITSYLGVEPILINSALVSAQNRERYYWTNIPGIIQPEDQHIYLKDVVLSDVEAVLLHNIYGGFNEEAVRVFENKSPTIRTSAGGGHIPSAVKKSLALTKEATARFNFITPDFEGDSNAIINMNGKIDTEKSSTLEANYAKGPEQHFGSRPFVIEKLVLSEKELDYMFRKTSDGRDHWDFGHYSDIEEDKSSAIVANFFRGVPYNVFKDRFFIRKLHPIECERLQTVPDNYTEGVSNTQRYKMLGNGWTISVISHIFSFMKEI